eukprot:3160079-Rhodomonas_salina.1
MRAPAFSLLPAGPMLPQSEHGPASSIPRRCPLFRTQSGPAPSVAALHPSLRPTAAPAPPARLVPYLRHRHRAAVYR